MACFIVPMTEGRQTVVGRAKKAKEEANKPANSPDPESGSEKESRILLHGSRSAVEYALGGRRRRI